MQSQYKSIKSNIKLKKDNYKQDLDTWQLFQAEPSQYISQYILYYLHILYWYQYIDICIYNNREMKIKKRNGLQLCFKRCYCIYYCVIHNLLHNMLVMPQICVWKGGKKKKKADM